jgi:eukaryotic-like serine/threonine-protein kinase
MQGREVPSFGGEWSRSAPDAREHDSLSLIGSVVDGRYLVERLVGSGGFGLVYRATHLRFHSAVALKVLRVPPQCTSEQRERFVARFAEEGRLAFNLGALHPGIVRVFEAGTLSSAGGATAPYLAMEWLDGVPLAELVAERRVRGQAPLTLSDTLELLELAAQGLAAAHRSRVAHCDVKPANLFVCSHDGLRVAKLLDFGLAEVVIESVTASSSADSASSRRAFTSAYAAPEQWLAGLGRTGLWTDVHALALVCTELLSGRRAFEENDPRQLMAACLDQSARPTPGRRGVQVPEAVERVFEKALAVSPKSRFRDVAEFWEALRSASGSAWSSSRLRVSPALASVDAGPASPQAARLDSATAPTRSARHDTARPPGPVRERRSSPFSVERPLLRPGKWVALCVVAYAGWLLVGPHVSSQGRGSAAPAHRGHVPSSSPLPPPPSGSEPARMQPPVASAAAASVQPRHPGSAAPRRPRVLVSTIAPASTAVAGAPSALPHVEPAMPHASSRASAGAELDQLLQRPALITRQ